MKLTAQDIMLIVGLFNSRITRYEKDLRYTQAGNAKYNAEKIKARIKRLRSLRDQLIQTSTVTIAEKDDD